ncbi:DUF6494 family protein [Pseudoprimorskyibacter insulae]|uniref:Uncharacterized protein n=1 Tax=Pseudoprimorskyibacter insulae TaxID=1695997 RepID=A0A2R8B085_9RHOB|nr:DUF6494 family protein [Pseudoprimorskyibacter insulae]SPF81678.1 hypothetical protein PRI8871_03503 [Pseudoprimorskyibacter insulae]
MPDEFNMSMRKFLKQVGVTSQQAIEEALRNSDAAGKTYSVKAVVTIEELGMTHEVTGEIKGDA